MAGTAENVPEKIKTDGNDDGWGWERQRRLEDQDVYNKEVWRDLSTMRQKLAASGQNGKQDGKREKEHGESIEKRGR